MIIYKATNKINNMCYIGQTRQELRFRIKRHISDAMKKNDKLYFHNALRSYGSDNFKWTILEVCMSIEELNEKEQWYIKHFNSLDPGGYNLNSGGKVFIISEKTRKKMSESAKIANKYKMTDEVKAKISSSLTGRSTGRKGIPASDESKEKNRIAHLGKHHTEESKKKISATLTGFKRPYKKRSKKI